MTEVFYKNCSPSIDLQNELRAVLQIIENLLPYGAFCCCCLERNPENGLKLTLNANTQTGKFNVSFCSDNFRDLLNGLLSNAKLQITKWRKARFKSEDSQFNEKWYSKTPGKCDPQNCFTNKCPLLDDRKSMEHIKL
jgi:hypothetical protein